MQTLFRISLLIWGLCFWVGCQDHDGQVITPKPADAPKKKYEVLKEQETANGKALAIQITSLPSKDTLVSMVKQIAQEKGLANLQVYASRAAFEAVQKPELNDAYRKGFILIYKKEKNGNGEIWWMQEEGPLASLSGTVMPL